MKRSTTSWQWRTWAAAAAAAAGLAVLCTAGCAEQPTVAHTGSIVATAYPTPEDSPSPTPTATPVPTATPTPVPTATPTLAAPATAAPAPAAKPPTARPAPPPTAAPASSDPYPAATAAGATAVCADGTLSYSQHRSGTCSHHGGVHWWTGNLGPAGPGDH